MATLTPPALGATKAAWADYADELGIDTDGLTKAEIVEACEDYEGPDVELESDVDDDTDDGLSAVPEALQFSSTIVDDEQGAEDDVVTFSIDGLTCTLRRPSDTALALRYAEYQAASSVEEQVLAMLGLLSVSMDRSSYVYLRQTLLAPRQPGKKFNDNLIADIGDMILTRWGGSGRVNRDQDKPSNVRPIQNRAARRARNKKKR